MTCRTCENYMDKTDYVTEGSYMEVHAYNICALTLGVAHQNETCDKHEPKNQDHVKLELPNT